MQEVTFFISRHPVLSLIVLLLIVLVLIIEGIRARRGSMAISSVKATQLINHDNAVVIDIRSTEAYQKGHIIDAISVMASDIVPENKKLEKYRTKPLIIVCGAGVSSQKIATLLGKAGYNAYTLAGGMKAWLDAGMPVVKG